MQITLIIVWIIFFVIFLVLGWWHFCQSNQKIPYATRNKRPMQLDDSPIKINECSFLGSDLDQPLDDFIYEFNQYIDIQNNNSHKAHLIAAIGYWMASITSIISGIIQIFE